MTSVGNERGQVLISVLTTHEGQGLEQMLTGLIQRYAKPKPKEPAPQLLYVDRDCCSEKLKATFQSAWPGLTIRLDIWHFMRRIASGVTTDSHPLYKSFMAGLSRAIFMWDKDDLDLLKEAKKQVMLDKGIGHPTEADVIRAITRREMALHCKRVTRGVEVTTRLISALLEAYAGPQGRDTLGVPLLDSSRMEGIWEEQKKHVSCLQDPPGISLYSETGTMVKGGRLLMTYRCARGSTSLESFHLHLNRFIPGENTFFLPNPCVYVYFCCYFLLYLSFKVFVSVSLLLCCCKHVYNTFQVTVLVQSTTRPTCLRAWHAGTRIELQLPCLPPRSRGATLV